NDRDPRYHDVYKVNIQTGERTLVEKNEQEVAGYVTDEDLKIRFAQRSMDDGGEEYLKRDGDKWVPFDKVPATDTMTTSLSGFDKSGNILYMTDSRGRNTGALFALDLTTGAKKLIAEH